MTTNYKIVQTYKKDFVFLYGFVVGSKATERSNFA